jgi:6-pyruvoyl tetrahydropterin synthase/QueD family protein
MYRIHRSVDISFAHHIRGHRGRCINIHGHTWKFEVCLEAAQLDKEGFVVDFGLLQATLLKPCYDLLDHALAVGQDTFAEIEKSTQSLGEILVASRVKIHGQSFEDPYPKNELGGANNEYPGGIKLAVFPESPTSERLARWLFDTGQGLLTDDRVRIAWTKIYETLHPVESVACYMPASAV